MQEFFRCQLQFTSLSKMSTNCDVILKKFPKTVLSFQCLKNQQNWYLMQKFKCFENKGSLEEIFALIWLMHIVWKLPKSLIWILVFSNNFCPIKIDLSGRLVTLFDHNLQLFKNVNVARFAHNVEWDFFCEFQTPWNGELLSLTKGP